MNALDVEKDVPEVNIIIPEIITMKINLFYMSKVKYGGFAAYTSHLCRAFRATGYDCNIYKVRVRTERKERYFLDDIGYTNISTDDAMRLMKYSDYSIVTATYWKEWHENISKLIVAGSEVVLHDHTDCRGDFQEFLQSYDVRPIVIRRANYRTLKQAGLNPAYIPHPYVPSDYGNIKRDIHAISVCRLDYDKHSDIIISANELLPEDKQVRIWGSHKRGYMYNKIFGKYDGWNDKANFIGPNYPKEQHNFPGDPGFAVELNASAKFSCDMSAIKGDGGGTQYSFLEAINGNATLVLNRKWFVDDTDELVEGTNCLAVSDAEELADLLYEGDYKEFSVARKCAKEVMNNHSPENVVPVWIKFLKGKL